MSRWARLGLLLLLSLVLGAACSGQPASYPDQDRVVAAQKLWCDKLAQRAGAGAGFEREHRAACEAAYPTASAEMLVRVASCYEKLGSSLGDEAPDSGYLLQTCWEEVLLKITVGDVSSTEVIVAWCERMGRCQQISAESCQQGIAGLDEAQRALLTTVYNLRARSELAECLRDSPCSQDEDRARDACYAPVLKRRVWLPL